MNGLVTALRPFNAVATVREAREVWAQFRSELNVSDVEPDCAEEILVARLAGRLGIAILISEVIGTYLFSPTLSLVGQYVPGGSWWIGLFGGIIGDYVPAVVSYGIAALALSARFYREGGRFQLGRFARDVGYVYYCAGGAALLLYVMEIVVCTGWVKFIELFDPVVAHNIPVAFWLAFGNGTFSEMLYLAAASGFIPRAAARMAKEYRAYLVRKAQSSAIAALTAVPSDAQLPN